MRMIDKDEAIKILCDGCTADCDVPYTACITVQKIIDMPTIEPEVRHGRWIEETEPDENGNVIAMCNQCYHTDEHCVNIKILYCWYCGARMDATDTNGGGKGGNG